MTARPIAVVKAADGYAGILKAFRDRQAQLKLSGEHIDKAVGNDGNRSAAKWLSGMKALGPKSWGDALGATCMYMVFFEDEEALARLSRFMERNHLEPANASYVRPIARIRVTRWLFTPRSARKAAKTRASRMTKEQRTASARKAAKARWRRVREARRAARNAPATPPAAMG